MAACGSLTLQHIFEKPLPESPTLLESLSPWKAIKNMKPVENSTFTEIFGELHFKENHHQVEHSSSSSSSPSSPLFSHPVFAEQEDGIVSTKRNNERSKSPTSSFCPSSHGKHYKHSDSFSSMNSESLSLCTEGLGFESSDDVEDLGNEASFDLQQTEEKEKEKEKEKENVCFSSRNSQPESSIMWKESTKRSRTNKGSFPPPISCIGRAGKPWVCFRSYREDGRFILQEIRFPTQEFLHACREDGRLRLQYIQSDDEILGGDEEEEDDDDDDDDDSFEDFEDVVTEDNHEHHQEYNNDVQNDVDEVVQMRKNDVLDSSK